MPFGLMNALLTFQSLINKFFNWNIKLCLWRFNIVCWGGAKGSTTFCWCCYFERFFRSSSGFGLLWQDNFEITGCIFLLVSRSEWFPFERVISLCFVFRSLRFGSVLTSFSLLDFAFLACSLHLFVLVVSPCIGRDHLWAVCLDIFVFSYFVLSIILLYFDH